MATSSNRWPNRCECFTSADRHEDAVAFDGAQVRLDGFSERPGQLGFLHASLHGHESLVVRFGQMLELRTALSGSHAWVFVIYRVEC
jgi:hypothetical protein